ncbi:hypothetical protein A3F06_00215 [candidate division TM6 bacterium RIFCSPHIGHO2_12_FULL_36_22]|nr:MAG: hypothetical protein A3F06_00215 [candidate division TM6 bacterium RIFCSPHIGHO2_12_FULL_36_22]
MSDGEEIKERRPWQEPILSKPSIKKFTPDQQKLSLEKNSYDPFQAAYELWDTKLGENVIEQAFSEWSHTNHKPQENYLYEHPYKTLEELVCGFVLVHRNYVSDMEKPPCKKNATEPSESLLHFAVRSGAEKLITTYKFSREDILERCDRRGESVLALAFSKAQQVNTQGSPADKLTAFNILNYLQRELNASASDLDLLFGPPSH